MAKTELWSIWKPSGEKTGTKQATKDGETILPFCLITTVGHLSSPSHHVFTVPQLF